MSVNSPTSNPVYGGCCDFQIPTKDHSIICGRSMEFCIPMNSTINVHTRGEKLSSEAPDKSPGLQWVSKYGYVGINAFGISDPDEGINEMGLSFGFLSMTGSEYQTVSEDQKKSALGILDVGAWILGNFATVEEVKKALEGVRIWGNFTDPVTKSVMGLHIALHDKDGKNLVVEFINGAVLTHDNPIGVLTNEPPFPFHLENLKHYNSLTPENAPEVTINGVKVANGGLGSGMLGLPGDWTSISRYIRTATLIRVATIADTAAKGVNLADHILSALDRPEGTTIVKVENTELYETTQWVTIKDLTHKVLFYRSYEDTTLRSINLNEIDFSHGKCYKPMKLSTGQQQVIDMTKHLFV